MLSVMRSHYQQSQMVSAGGFSGAPVTKFVFIAVIVVFLLGLLTKEVGVFAWLSFSMDSAVYGFQIWRFISYAFVHLDGWSLASTLLLLFYFGRMLEQEVRQRKFVVLLALSALSAPLAYMLMYVAGAGGDGTFPIVGFSAMSFGLLSTLYCSCGDRLLRLMFLEAPIKLKWIVLLFGGLNLISIIRYAGGLNHPIISHLAGIVVGVLVAKYLWNVQWVNSSGQPKKKRQKKVASPKIKPRSRYLTDDSEVDKILDKISAEGFQSLTDEEREILDKASKNEG